MTELDVGDVGRIKTMVIVLVLFSVLFGFGAVSVAFIMGASFWACLAIYAGTGATMIFLTMVYVAIGEFGARHRGGENKAA